MNENEKKNAYKDVQNLRLDQTRIGEERGKETQITGTEAQRKEEEKIQELEIRIQALGSWSET